MRVAPTGVFVCVNWNIRHLMVKCRPMNETQIDEHRIDWTVAELAQKAGLTPHRIRQLILAGEIRAVKRGRDWRIMNSEALRWFETRGLP